MYSIFGCEWLDPPQEKETYSTPWSVSLPPKKQGHSHWYFRKLMSTATWFLTLPEGYLTCLLFLCSMEGQSSIPSNSLERKQLKWTSYSTNKIKLQCIYSTITPFLLSWWFTMLWQSFSSLELRYLFWKWVSCSFGKYPPFQRSTTDDMLVNHEMFTRWGKGTDMAQ